MNVILMFMECLVELLIYPSSGLSPYAFSTLAGQEGNPQLCFSINLSVDVLEINTYQEIGFIYIDLICTCPSVWRGWAIDIYWIE